MTLGKVFRASEFAALIGCGCSKAGEILRFLELGGYAKNHDAGWSLCKIPGFNRDDLEALAKYAKAKIEKEKQEKEKQK